ncbi:MAG: hypothetical protein AAFQ79_10235 [Pseudomonadota bacterium]
MSRANPGRLALFLCAVLIFALGPAILKGGVFLTAYEGDALHVSDIVMRMAAGQLPHLDFETPLGLLSFAPIAVFVGQGQSLGLSYLYAQALAGLVALPLIYWCVGTRLPWVAAYLLGAAALLVITSLSYGVSNPPVTIAMHYNRWGWGLLFAAALLICLPAQDRPRPRVDGWVLGLILSLLALVKATYFVVLAPLAVIAFLMRGQRDAIVVMLLTGLVVMGVTTVFTGPTFWVAYVRDLLSVSSSDVRQYPGLAFAPILVSPPYFVATLIAIIGALLLRSSGQRTTGLLLLLFVPAFAYVTFQNFGNDALWVIPLAAILLAARPKAGQMTRFGWDTRGAVSTLAAMAAALAIPHVQSLGAGALRHYTLDPSGFEPLLADTPDLADIHTVTLRANSVRAARDTVVPGDLYPMLADPEEDTDPVTVAGEPIPDCRLEAGVVGALKVQAAEIADLDGPVFIADVLSAHWLLNDTDPLPGASPWNYGNIAGLDTAAYVYVPTCAVSAKARDAILRALAEAPVTLEEVGRNPRAITYRITRGSDG